jgi:hypothetical protein
MSRGLAIALIIAAAILLGLSVGRPYLTNLITNRIDRTPQPRSTGFSVGVATNQNQSPGTPIQPANPENPPATDDETTSPSDDRPINGQW